ncbi:hypothetical protein Tco_0807360 [Tanacetum coccineum]
MSNARQKLELFYFQSLHRGSQVTFIIVDDAKDIWWLTLRYMTLRGFAQRRYDRFHEGAESILNQMQARQIMKSCNMKFRRSKPSWSQVLEIDVKGGSSMIQEFCCSPHTQLSLVLQLFLENVLFSFVAGKLAMLLFGINSFEKEGCRKFKFYNKDAARLIKKERSREKEGGFKDKLFTDGIFDDGVFVATSNGSDDVSVVAGVGSDDVSVASGVGSDDVSVAAWCLVLGWCVGTSSDATMSDTQFCNYGLSPQARIVIMNNKVNSKESRAKQGMGDTFRSDGENIPSFVPRPAYVPAGSRNRPTSVRGLWRGRVRFVGVEGDGGAGCSFGVGESCRCRLKVKCGSEGEDSQLFNIFGNNSTSCPEKPLVILFMLLSIL